MFNLISEKPYLGFIASGGGLVSALLTWLKVVTPVLGCLGALFGAIAGFITLLIKLREWKQIKQNPR